MGSDPFLVIASTRADHLRQLRQHERALEWVNASLSEVEAEIPDLELAMAVFKRLNPKAPDHDGNGQPGFLSITGVRADHLLQLSQHMRALNLVSAPLAEIEAEIPELESAMSVYRRLVPEESAEVATNAAAESGKPPSFREYALQHLDPAADTGR